MAKRMGGCHPDLYNNLLGLVGENVEMIFYLCVLRHKIMHLYHLMLVNKYVDCN